MRSGPTYLALALDVRKLTDSLIRLVEDGVRTEELYESIRRCLDRYCAGLSHRSLLLVLYRYTELIVVASVSKCYGGE